MARVDEVAYQFVQTIPDQLEPKTLYISLDHAVALHLCCCGCGNEVVNGYQPARLEGDLRRRVRVAIPISWQLEV
jgi:hypothetical protein